MSLWDKLSGEFVDVIEWTEDRRDTIVHRFERHNNEIKYEAQLTVRESQQAVFVNEGEIADVFEPGMYTLETANLPLLSTLQGWIHGFESPFKAEVYFVSTRRFTDLKWGTRNPIMLRDPEFGPLRLRAFGTYEIRVVDPALFLQEVSGTDDHFTTDEITEQLRSIIVSGVSSILGEARIPVLDLAANYDDLADFVQNAIQPVFRQYGLELCRFVVENVSLPKVVEEALDKRTSMGVIGDLKRYAQFQTAEAMAKAAEAPGGLAGGGLGIGMGLAMAQHMGRVLAPGGSAEALPAARSEGPPPLPASPSVALSVYVALEGQQAGPFGRAQLQRLVAEGRLSPETLVWFKGLAEWKTAVEVPALEALFAERPPPLPR
jgi:membrane protease subunit (stomatin/prohibitin family)